ncbi:MAG TPA: nucleoside triphosphate pyrophosphohydrolase [Candidatus Paceibacterota bacterium]|nr:nucleoside triphosphate pyrophosphohydrolase [Candidatus Paceibacterota bacterium]
MIQKYNKLVRDRIPEIIRAKGLIPVVHNERDPLQFTKRLRDKLLEEVNEFMESGKREELADILEVVHACADFMGIGWDRLVAIKE